MGKHPLFHNFVKEGTMTKLIGIIAISFVAIGIALVAFGAKAQPKTVEPQTKSLTAEWRYDERSNEWVTLVDWRGTPSFLAVKGDEGKVIFLVHHECSGKNNDRAIRATSWVHGDTFARHLPCKGKAATTHEHRDIEKVLPPFPDEIKKILEGPKEKQWERIPKRDVLPVRMTKVDAPHHGRVFFITVN